jgi:hypothetical protein
MLRVRSFIGNGSRHQLAGRLETLVQPSNDLIGPWPAQKNGWKSFLIWFKSPRTNINHQNVVFSFSFLLWRIFLCLLCIFYSNLRPYTKRENILSFLPQPPRVPIVFEQKKRSFIIINYKISKTKVLIDCTVYKT